MSQSGIDYNQQLTIVLPCYNPPQGWAQNVVENYWEISKAISQEPKLIIVNDGSNKNLNDTDMNFIKEKIPAFSFLSYVENKGKGHALREGVKQAKTNLIIYTDIDFPYENESFVAVYQTLLKNTDVAPGHRGTDYYKNTPFLRKIISKTLRKFLKTFLRLPTDDSQCGIKGFNQNGAAVFCDTRINRFLFDLEFLKLASRRKLSITNVGVTLRPNVVFSKVSFKILAREGLNFIKVLFRK